MTCETVLEVNNLSTCFRTRHGEVRAVSGVSFKLAAGQTLGLVGESGCGKTVTALSLVGLVDPPGEVYAGEVLFGGQNLLELNKKQLREIRGQEIAFVFQDPLTSLNPVLSVGTQMIETILAHRKMSREMARQRAVELLGSVGLPDPEKMLHRYPFQLSGGMRQRVMIAMAFSLQPRILIADEPTTALDVTVQAQILNEMKRLKREFGTAIILITHDLGVVAELADIVAVMYAGSIVEMGSIADIFINPAHPYTQALLRSVPRLSHGNIHLEPVKGQPPSLLNLPDRCAFLPRCPQSKPVCAVEKPQLQEVGSNHKVACHCAVPVLQEAVFA
ncbi:MAG: ABC transporter ATP-binding protein [Syntrophomonadaceae bacterium]|nr:ABC transporter ATP-binding protein [Syntrophomonadaceae bacterium]